MNGFIGQDGLLYKGAGCILAELEKKHLTPNAVTFQDSNDCCCIVNVMYHIIKVPTAQLKTFGELVSSFLDSILRSIPSKTTRIDSSSSRSLKDISKNI